MAIASKLAEVMKCQCGCGMPAPLTKRTNARLGHKKGQPLPRVSGHNSKGKGALRYEIVDCGYITPCWISTGARNRKGYARSQRNGVHTGAHRVSYEQHRGPIPDGLPLDHLCKQRPCINPDHLEPVTTAENNRRSRALALVRRMIAVKSVQS